MPQPTHRLATLGLLLSLSLTSATVVDYSFYPTAAQPCLYDAFETSGCDGTATSSSQRLNHCLCNNGGNFVAKVARCVYLEAYDDFADVYYTMWDACDYTDTPLVFDGNDFSMAAGEDQRAAEEETTTSTTSSEALTTTTSAVATETDNRGSAVTDSVSPSKTTTPADGANGGVHKDESTTGLSTGATVGIGLGGALGGASLVGIIAFLIIRRLRRPREIFTPVIPKDFYDKGDHSSSDNNNDREDSTYNHQNMSSVMNHGGFNASSGHVMSGAASSVGVDSNVMNHNTFNNSSHHIRAGSIHNNSTPFQSASPGPNFTHYSIATDPRDSPPGRVQSMHPSRVSQLTSWTADSPAQHHESWPVPPPPLAVVKPPQKEYIPYTPYAPPIGVAELSSGDDVAVKSVSVPAPAAAGSKQQRPKSVNGDEDDGRESVRRPTTGTSSVLLTGDEILQSVAVEMPGWAPEGSESKKGKDVIEHGGNRTMNG